jgi:hypothetical protein
MKRITFFPNNKSDFHCGQAVMSMMLSAYGMHFEFDELDYLLKQKGVEGIWDMQILNVMSSFGFEGHKYSSLSMRRFAREGIPYMKWFFGKKRFLDEDRYTDWDVIRSEARRVLKDPYIKTFVRPAQYSDIQRYVRNGWMVVPFVNSLALQGREGFAGHIVLVTAITPT